MTNQVTSHVTQEVARVLGAARWGCSFAGLRTALRHACNDQAS
jgi:hypothetical protein